MADLGAQLPGALEPERFFGRVAELSRLSREARMLARGLGRSRILCARPGLGKTQLLRQWHQRLFAEGEILPFWYTVPGGARDPAALGEDFLGSLALQALAFRRRDASMLTRPLPHPELAEGLRSTWGEGGLLLTEALLARGAGHQCADALARVALVPHRLAEITGTRIQCLVDDAGHLAATASPWPETALASPIAPALFTLESESLLPLVFGLAAPAAASVERLAPLSAEASSRLARHLARTAGLELEERAVAFLAGESAGSPFYAAALVRALAEQPGTGVLDVARAAAAAVSEGELARYWIGLLTAAIPDRRIRASALEILTFCLREREAGHQTDRLAALMLKPETDVESALSGLARAGVVRLDSARVVVDDDPVLRDVVQALYRQEFGRVPAMAVTAGLAAEKVRGAPAERRRLRREALRGALRAVLEAWSGQEVPAALFDSAAGRADEGGFVTLPRVISAVSGRVGSGLSLPALEVDALAWALRADAGEPESDVAWVARFLAGGPDGAEQVERFDRDIAALQMAGELPAARVVRWALLETPLDAAGAESAARLRLSTSTLQQLEALARLLGVDARLPPPEEPSPVVPELELEMVIPRVADIELVAARALEQLAENLEIEAPVIGRLKMALVEACINAFEHGGARDGRVRLQFFAGRGRLAMRVENRGRPLAALPARAGSGREARGRGWGLTLIRELVDEVTLEPREDGVSLLMIKRLSKEAHG